MKSGRKGETKAVVHVDVDVDVDVIGSILYDMHGMLPYPSLPLLTLKSYSLLALEYSRKILCTLFCSKM